jgi:hypothetical protein
VVVVCKRPVFGDDELLDNDFMVPRQRSIAWLEGAQSEAAFPVDGSACNPSGSLGIGCDHSTELDCPQTHRLSVRKADQSIDWVG